MLHVHVVKLQAVNLILIGSISSTDAINAASCIGHIPKMAFRTPILTQCATRASNSNIKRAAEQVLTGADMLVLKEHYAEASMELVPRLLSLQRLH